MTPSYNWHTAAMAGKNAPVHDGEPELGWFKKRSAPRSKVFIPAAIYMKDGEMVCRVGDEFKDPVTEWTLLAKFPISSNECKQMFEAKEWLKEPVTETESAPLIGDNSAGVGAAELLKEGIAAVNSWLAKTEITTKALADEAAKKRGELSKLRIAADKERKAEKEVHLKASRDVDARYNPFIKDAKASEKALVDAAQTVLLEEARKQRLIDEAAAEAARKEAMRIADEERKLQEQMHAEMAQQAEAIGAPPPEPLPEPEPVAVEPPKKTVVKAGGVSGRQMRVKTVDVVVIKDYRMALEHFADHVDVKALIAKLADLAMSNGEEVPGCEIEKKDVVK